MKILSDADLDALYAGVPAHLHGEAWGAAVNALQLSTLPIEGAPGPRFRNQLSVLNAMGPLADGKLPLRRALEVFKTLAVEARIVKILEETLAKIDARLAGGLHDSEMAAPESSFAEIKLLLADDDLDNAVARLVELARGMERLENEAILLSGRVRNLERRKRSGAEPEDTLRALHVALGASALSLVDELARARARKSVRKP